MQSHWQDLSTTLTPKLVGITFSQCCRARQEWSEFNLFLIKSWSAWPHALKISSCLYKLVLLFFFFFFNPHDFITQPIKEHKALETVVFKWVQEVMLQNNQQKKFQEQLEVLEVKGMKRQISKWTQINMTMFSLQRAKAIQKNSYRDINNHCLCDVLNLWDFRVRLSKN